MKKNGKSQTRTRDARTQPAAARKRQPRTDTPSRARSPKTARTPPSARPSTRAAPGETRTESRPKILRRARTGDGPEFFAFKSRRFMLNISVAVTSL